MALSRYMVSSLDLGDPQFWYLAFTNSPGDKSCWPKLVKKGTPAERELTSYREFSLAFFSSFFPPVLPFFLLSSLAERCPEFRFKAALCRLRENYKVTHLRVCIIQTQMTPPEVAVEFQVFLCLVNFGCKIVRFAFVPTDPRYNLHCITLQLIYSYEHLYYTVCILRVGTRSSTIEIIQNVYF